MALGPHRSKAALRADAPLLHPHPECSALQVCGAPFKGIGGFVLGRLGLRPWEKNPSICRACIADVRGSTGIAERSSPFASLLHRFYAIGSQAIIEENGIVDKFVGDEVVALFIPVYAGQHHATRALRCADRLLRQTGHGRPNGPWLDVGIGIHSGIAFVGTVAVGGEVTDFTALGDTVNAAARLASEAGAGEVLISEDALANAGIGNLGLKRRELRLRGRSAPLAVRTAMVDSLPLPAM